MIKIDAPVSATLIDFHGKGRLDGRWSRVTASAIDAGINKDGVQTPETSVVILGAEHLIAFCYPARYLQVCNF